jgi:chaperonin GroES
VREAVSEVRIQPLGARVLVRPLVENQARTGGGLFIPESTKEDPRTGEVVAIGDGEEIRVRPGQKILFPRNTGVVIRLDGEEHLIIHAENILAIIHD